MAELILKFLYYIVVGFFALFYKLFGISPFPGPDAEKKSYWLPREKDSPPYRFTKK